MEKRLSYIRSASIFIGCVLVGAGIGFYQGRADIGAVIGLGAGFILNGIVGMFYRRY